nr:hypothetical protein [Ruegeria sp. NA]
MSQAKTRVLRTTIPAGLVGKRDGLFFLWGEIERARLKIEDGAHHDSATPDGPNVNMADAARRLVQVPVDEFIFY